MSKQSTDLQIFQDREGFVNAAVDGHVILRCECLCMLQDVIRGFTEVLQKIEAIQIIEQANRGNILPGEKIQVIDSRAYRLCN